MVLHRPFEPARITGKVNLAREPGLEHEANPCLLLDPHDAGDECHASVRHFAGNFRASLSVEHQRGSLRSGVAVSVWNVRTQRRRWCIESPTVYLEFAP